MQVDLFSVVEVIEPMTPDEARQCVQEIRSGIDNIGMRLLELYERQGWIALGYLSWRECAQAEFGYRRSRVYQLLEAAEIQRNISTIVETETVRESHIRPLAALPPDLQREAWREAVETAPNGKVTGPHVQSVVDRMTKPEPDKQRAQQAMGATVYSHNSLDYYTPRYVTDAARDVMGGIDLDPASCEMAQRWINAGAFYTIDDDGLRQDWFGRVWLNPPYSYTDGRSNQDLWSDRLVTEYNSGNVQEGLLLVKAALGYKWFERLWDVWPVCFMRDRLSFVLPDGTDDGQSKQATAIFYIGPNVARFAQVFSKFGRVILPEDQIIG